MSSDNRIKSRKVYSLFYIIIIGAIGSGIWDLFLRDLIYWFGDVFVKIASSLHQGYFDRLYEDVGKQLDVLLYFPSIFMILILVLSPIIFYGYITVRFKRIGKTLTNENEEVETDFNKYEEFIINQFIKHRTRLKIILIIPLIICSIMYIDILIVSVTNIKAVRNVNRRLEIIRPYISENQHHLLISKFRMVEDRDNMQELIVEIEQLANNQKLKLPKLNLYGIDPSNKTNAADAKSSAAD